MFFSFEAKDAEGKEVRGEREAASRIALARLLRDEGFFVIAIEPAREVKNDFVIPLLNRVQTFFSHISLVQKVMFAKNLGVMVGAGLSLPRALEALRSETSHVYFKKVIGDLEERTKQGTPLSEALHAHPRVFSELFAAMVAAGEKTGKLDESLAFLTHQMENDYQLRRRVRGALMYPAIVLFAMIGVGILMLITVVPTLVSTFKELGVDLPASTRAIIAVSDFLITRGFLALSAVLAILVGSRFLAQRARIKRMFQQFFLKIPLIGVLLQKINTARSARTLSSLLSAGVQMLEALTITARVLTHFRYRGALERAKEEIQRGKTLSSILKDEGDLFPHLFAEMIAVGEETGKLSSMLREVADFYEAEVAESTKNLSTIIEPFLMIMMGIVVGFFAVSMITPLYSMLGNI